MYWLNSWIATTWDLEQISLSEPQFFVSICEMGNNSTVQDYLAGLM